MLTRNLSYKRYLLLMLRPFCRKSDGKGQLYLPHLPCCYKPCRSLFITSSLLPHYITCTFRLHKFPQVRSFLDASFVSVHSFPRTKAARLVEAMQLSRSASPAETYFTSISHSIPFVIHSSSIHRSLHAFRNPTAAYWPIPAYFRAVACHRTYAFVAFVSLALLTHVTVVR